MSLILNTLDAEKFIKYGFEYKETYNNKYCKLEYVKYDDLDNNWNTKHTIWPDKRRFNNKKLRFNNKMKQEDFKQGLLNILKEQYETGDDEKAKT